MLKFAIAAVAATAAAFAGASAGAAYPEKNIDFVIPFAPGGGFDRTVRMIAPYLEKYLPNKVEVLAKNVAGAGGQRGMTTVYRARPDGYTIGIANMPGAALPAVLGQHTEYDIEKFTWVARLATAEYLMAVGAKTPLRTIDDMRKLGRAVKFTSTDAGATGYAATVIATQVMKIPAHHLLGYTGSTEYIVAVVRGDGEATMAPVASLRQFLQAGDMRAVFTTEASSSIPGIPTVAALGYGELTGLGVDRFAVAPPGLPQAILDTLSQAMAKAMADPELIAAAAKAGEPFSALPAREAKANADRSLATYVKYKAALAAKP